MRALAAWLVLGSFAFAQDPLYSVPLPSWGDHLYALPGDLDLDGVEDFAVALTGNGKVFSGIDGSEIACFESSFFPYNRITQFASVGDIDGDGDPDLAAGYDLDNDLRGLVEFYNAKTGAVLGLVYGQVHAYGDSFGREIVGLGDIDGDGRSDVAISGRNATSFNQRPGRIEVRSGGTGAVIWQLTGTETENIGRRMARLADMDGDGIPDLLAAGSSRMILSGATGALLFPPSTAEIGRVSSGQDINGDGIHDFVELHGDAISGPNHLEARSGADASLLWSVNLTSTIRGHAMVGDLTGDGRSEVACVISSASTNSYGLFLYDSNSNLLSITSPPAQLQPFRGGLRALDDIDGGGQEFLADTYTGTWVLTYDSSGCRWETPHFCGAEPNSFSPSGASIAVSGSLSISANDFDLVCSGVPPGQGGVFLLGFHPRSPFSFGEGFLCLYPPYFRIGAAVAKPSGFGQGTAMLSVDMTAPGLPVAPMETRFLQFWYRDPAGGGDGFNLSEALEVRFCP